MKATRSLKRVSIVNNRWIAYATAGAATAVAGVQSAEADIHYSGPVNQTFNATPGAVSTTYIQLDQPGNSLNPFHARTTGGTSGIAAFFMYGINAGSVAGFAGNGNGFHYASKLASGVTLNKLANFVSLYGGLAYRGGYTYSQWTDVGTGFVGFRFDGGSGLQYGWARIHMDEGVPGNSFTLIDFAYADFGDTIQAGQVPEPGSLALLALGGAGLLAWRRRKGGPRPIA